VCLRLTFYSFASQVWLMFAGKTSHLDGRTGSGSIAAASFRPLQSPRVGFRGQRVSEKRELCNEMLLDSTSFVIAVSK
jgi:hypothetical protein